MFKRALDNHLCSIEDSPMVPNECNSLNSRSKEKTHLTDKWRAAQARVQEFVRGGGPKSEAFFFFFLLFNFSGGGGPAQKLAEKMTFSTKKVAKYR